MRVIDTGQVNRGIRVNGKLKSIVVEAAFWEAFQHICEIEGCERDELITFIAKNKKRNTALTSALKTYCQTYFRNLAAMAGDPPYKGKLFELPRTDVSLDG